jgi:uncharacterized protein DUF4382
MVVNKALVVVVAVGLTAVAVGAGFYFLNNPTGSVSILVTDDAIDQFEHLNITFNQVALHRAGEGNDSGWTIIKLDNTTIDLTNLTDNITSQVGFDRVSAGSYTQLRIIVASAVGTLKTGQNVTVTVPSGELKTHTPFDLKGGGSATIVLRLIVHEAGGEYKLQPSLGSVNTSP